MVERVDIVDFEGDDGVARGSVELGAGRGPEDYGLVQHREIDRENGGHRAHGHAHTAYGGPAEQLQALGLLKDCHSLVFREHVPSVVEGARNS